MSKIHVSVVTPDRIVLKEEADMVTVKTTEGEIGILPNHVPIVAPLKIGAICIKAGKETKWLSGSGGFIEMIDNQLSIIAPTAELADSIDLARAEEARKRAEARIAQKEAGLDIKRAESALLRASNRVNVATRVIK